MISKDHAIVARFPGWQSWVASWVLLCGANIATAQTRTMEGRYLTINTDLPATEALGQLPVAFDAAVPQWCEFFDIDIDRVKDWHVTAHLMVSREAFKRRGVLPDNLPAFAHGYQWGDTVWVIGQPSDYYTRHLLLHEGVHALMVHLFGGAGPAWYMEGTAEFLATHDFDGRSITVGIVPDSREATPFWGRLKVLEQARQKQRVLSIDAVMRYSQKAHRQVEPYAWSWAALTLLQMYPEYRKTTIAAASRGTSDPRTFTRDYYAQLKDQWPIVQIRWAMLVDGLNYGFDVSRNQIDISDIVPWDLQSRSFNIAANRGWQSTGLKVGAGQSIKLSADGSYTIGNEPKPWVCEPQGVTIEYYRQRPLGMLLAAIVPTSASADTYLAPPQIVGVGREKTFQANEQGLLLLSIGDYPSSLDDNQGTVEVRMEAGDANR